MADVDGMYIAGFDAVLSSSSGYSQLGLIATEALVLGSLSTTYYFMQATDSVVTASVYTWEVAVIPDWSGLAYSGPNSPVDIAVIGQRIE